MILFFISILAGVLTILAPCILPLLPIVIGTIDGTQKGITKRAIRVIGSLSLSVIFFTLILKASTILIKIPNSFWAIFSGSIIIILGIITIYPNILKNLKFIQKININANKKLGEGYKQNNAWGDFIIGLSLGPIFTTCSPTYLFILATVLPATPLIGLAYLIGFTFGLAVSLLLVAYLGQRFVGKIFANQNKTEKIKKFFGILFIIVGLVIMLGLDKKLSTYLLDLGIGGAINFEERLLKDFK